MFVFKSAFLLIYFFISKIFIEKSLFLASGYNNPLNHKQNTTG